MVYSIEDSREIINVVNIYSRMKIINKLYYICSERLFLELQLKLKYEI